MVIAARDANQTNAHGGELDDIEAYVSTFSEEERRELAAAEAAIDIAILLNRARRQRGLSQTAAARLAGLKQQAISRFERPDANPRLETVQAYLGALGFALELKAIDIKTGDVAAAVVLPPTMLAASRRTRNAPRRRGGSRGKSAAHPSSSTRAG